MNLRVSVLLSCAAVLGLSVAPAFGHIDPNDFAGRWTGYTSGPTSDGFKADGPGRVTETQDAWMSVTILHDNVFQADLSMLGKVFSVQGTITLLGEVNASGRAPDRTFILIHGTVVQSDDNTYRFTSLQFKMSSGFAGAAKSGYVAFEQMSGGPGWSNFDAPHLEGLWHGYYAPAIGGLGPSLMSLDLTNIVGDDDKRTSLFEGSATLFDLIVGPTKMDRLFDVTATVGMPMSLSGEARVAALGLGPGGIVVQFVGLLHPPETESPAKINGQYKLYKNFGDLFNEHMTGDDMSFTHGTFVVYPVPSQ